MIDSKSQISNLIKSEAIRIGFDSCGISKAEFLEEEAPRLEKWLKNGMHGEMRYMENYFDKRLDPRLLVDGAKSIISLTLNYYPEKRQKDQEAPKISKYAYGEDYHSVIKQKLKELLVSIQGFVGDINGRAFVDSAPVMDKAWAKKSGLGWVGKNSNLITKNQGSFFFLAELIVDVDLVDDSPIKDYCGTCTKCIDACPTEAINTPYLVDGSKCISYFTIELKDSISLPEEYRNRFENWMFGCDICQDVCPWNRFSKPHQTPEFLPKRELLDKSLKEWEEITEDVFNALFKNSAVKRTKFKGLKRNIDFIKKPR